MEYIELRFTKPGAGVAVTVRGPAATPVVSLARAAMLESPSLNVDSSTLESSTTSVFVTSSRLGDKQSSSVSSYELKI